MNTLNVLQSAAAPAATGKGSASSAEGATGFGAAMQVALDIAGIGQPKPAALPGQAASDSASVRLPNNDGGAQLSLVEMAVPEGAADAGEIAGTASAEPEFAGLDTPGSTESQDLAAPAPGVISVPSAQRVPEASPVIFEASAANEVPAQQAADSAMPQSGTIVPDEVLPEVLVSRTPKPAPAVVLSPGLSTSIASSAGDTPTARPISRQGTAPLDGAAVPASSTGSLAAAASTPTAVTGATAVSVTPAGAAGPAAGPAPISMPSDKSVAAAPASQTTAADLPISATVPPSQLPATPPTPVPSVPGTAPAQAAAPAPAPLPAQLARPIFTLANATPGEHTLTINVAPDNLGPVTVRAHVTGEGLRVELFAPTDMARDALRAILPDLRRDLSGQGMHANLDLSSQDQPGDGGAAGSHRDPDRKPELAPRPRTGEQGFNEQSGNVPANNVRTGLFGAASTIDVMV